MNTTAAYRKSCDVVVFGDLFVDLILSGFVHLPELGEEGVASSFCRETGGGAVYTSCGLATLGARTRLMGAVGASDLAWFRERVAAKGVDTQALVSHPTEPSAVTVAVSTPSDRIFYTYAGANVSLPQLLSNPDTRRGMAEARHVHFAHLIEPARLAELTRWLHTQNCTVSLDVGWNEVWLDDLATLSALGEVDWFFPNEREAACMSGELEPVRILEWFQAHGVHGVVLKLGEQGSASLFRGRVVRRPVFPVQTLDTTGAGDCFDAGFLFAWMAGKPVKECLAWGNVCGALSTRCNGGIEGFPSSEEVQAALQRS